MALRSVHSNFKDNLVTVDFGKGNIINLKDYGDDVGYTVESNNRFSDPTVGATGSSDIRETNNRTATITFKLKEYSDENDHFIKWMDAVNNQDTTPINITVKNVRNNRKEVFSDCFVMKTPGGDVAGGKSNTNEWELKSLNYTMSVLA